MRGQGVRPCLGSSVAPCLGILPCECQGVRFVLGAKALLGDWPGHLLLRFQPLLGVKSLLGVSPCTMHEFLLMNLTLGRPWQSCPSSGPCSLILTPSRGLTPTGPNHKLVPKHKLCRKHKPRTKQGPDPTQLPDCLRAVATAAGNLAPLMSQWTCQLLGTWRGGGVGWRDVAPHLHTRQHVMMSTPFSFYPSALEDVGSNTVVQEPYVL